MGASSHNDDHPHLAAQAPARKPRAQPKASTERARAEHEVWGWWAHPQAQSAEDGDR